MEGRGEGLVDGEGVARLDLLGLGRLHQDPLAGLAHGQWLGGRESSSQLEKIMFFPLILHLL